METADSVGEEEKIKQDEELQGAHTIVSADSLSIMCPPRRGGIILCNSKQDVTICVVLDLS